MMDSGAFEEMWLELVEGGLHRMPPQGREHGRLQLALIARLLGLIPERRLFADVAIDLGNDTVLACDAAVIRGEPGTTPIVAAAEVLLVAEVAVSTADRDLGLKRRLYAAAGIPTYWVVDADRRVIPLFDRPEGGDYHGLALVRFGDPLPVPGTDGTVVLE